MSFCYPRCRHVEITPVMREIAQEQERLLREQKGANNPSTVPLSNMRDFVGALGQNCIQDFFETRGMEGGLIVSPYYNPHAHADKFDFSYRGTEYDVKSTQMRNFKAVNDRTSYLINDHQMNKRVGSYCFVSVDLDNDVCHIAGLISYDNFWSIAQPAVGSWVKGKAHIIEAKHLRSIEDIIA